MKLFLAALIAATGMAAPAVVLTATPAAAVTCGDNVPEGYKRPGGYCDQASQSGSLAAPDTDFVPPPPVAVPCNAGFPLPADFFRNKGAVVIVAAPIPQNNCPG